MSWGGSTPWAANDFVTEAKLDSMSDNTVWCKSRNDRMLIGHEHVAITGDNWAGDDLQFDVTINSITKSWNINATLASGTEIAPYTVLYDWDVSGLTGPLYQIDFVLTNVTEGEDMIPSHDITGFLANEASKVRYDYASAIVMFTMSSMPFPTGGNVICHHVNVQVWAHTNTWWDSWSPEVV